MAILNSLIVLFWIVFLMYWLISSIGVKKNVRGRNWWQGTTIRIIFVIFVFFVFHIPVFAPVSAYLSPNAIPTDLSLGIIGVIVTALGIALAIWARIYLGKNWGMPMSIKENPELVTAGPYRFVRHPIYSGFLLAMLGSALVEGPIWILFFALFLIYFSYSALQEEKRMAELFPNQYPFYKQKTKMLIPFLF